MPRFGLPGRLVQLVVGLALYGVALALMLRAGLGVAPWSALSQGVAGTVGLSYGLVELLIGAAVMLLWLPLQRPGLGTVLNVLIVGPAADVALPLVPAADVLWAQLLMFAAGLLLLVLATGLYLGADFGPGPRDGLMTAVSSRWKLPVGPVPGVIEVTVLGIGWALGGTVGLGTLAFALLVGPLLHLALPRLLPAGVSAGHAPAALAPLNAAR